MGEDTFPNNNPMKRKLLIIYVNISLICVMLVGMELLGQLIYFTIKGYPLYHRSNNDNPNKLLELHPYLVGRLRKNLVLIKEGKSVTTTDIHTRWTGFPKNNDNMIRVAILGGSTAFGAHLTDNDSWPAILQRKLGDRFSVINYGVYGYTTTEAIIQLALIVPEMKPHLIIFYEGWNDIKNYHDTNLSPDYYSHGMRQYKTLKIPVNRAYNDRTLFQKLEKISAIVRLSSYLRRSFKTTRGKSEKDKSEINKNKSFVAYTYPDPFVDRIYLRNLKTLKVLAESIGAYSMFVPQVLNYSWYRGRSDSHGWSPHIVNSAMPKLMDRFNMLMKSVCSKEASNCAFLNDVLAERWNPEDFITNGHFSRKGGEKFAEIIAQLILQKVSNEDYSKSAESGSPDRYPATILTGR